MIVIVYTQTEQLAYERAVGFLVYRSEIRGSSAMLGHAMRIGPWLRRPPR